MATTIKQAFDGLLADLLLTETQKAKAEGRVNHLVSYFRDRDIVCADLPFKIGSYERGTVIRWRRDIDIMVALDYATYRARYDNDSAGMLRWVRDRMNAEYRNTQVTRQQVAVRMFLGDDLQVDLVPAFRRRGGGFFMPNGKGGWTSTNPRFHAAAMTKANVALNSKLKPLVRVMKAWNEVNGRHLRSFHLEMMAWEMWNNEKALPVLPQAVAETLRKLDTWLAYPMQDPWTGVTAATDAYLSTSERGVAKRLAKADAKRAADALAFDRAGKTADAFERWNVIFNGRFPAYR